MLRTDIRSATPKPTFSLDGRPVDDGSQLPAWILPTVVAVAATLLLAVIGLTVLLTRAPDRTDLARERQQIQDFLAKGQSEIAIGLAEAALAQRNPPPSAEAKRAVAGLWYAASMETLLVGPTVDELLNPRAPLKWAAIEEKADTYGLPKAERLSATRLARRAYDARNWPLADAALRRAWEAGDVGIEAVGMRYAVLRNWGGELAYRGSPQVRAEGVRLLATAQAIARLFNLPNGEACQDLHGLGHADCNAAVPDSSDPMLARLGMSEPPE